MLNFTTFLNVSGQIIRVTLTFLFLKSHVEQQRLVFQSVQKGMGRINR